MNGPTRRRVLAAGATLVAAPAVGAVTLSPAGRAAPVLIFDVARADPPRPVPLLRFRADGRAVVRTGDGTAQEVDFGRDRLKALLTFAVEAQDFFTIDAAAIEARIEARAAEGGPMFNVADAPVSHIAIDLGGGRRHAVTLYATAMAATLYPGIAPLRRLRRIELCLLETLAALRAGDAEGQ